jgi:hypothetical protein
LIRTTDGGASWEEPLPLATDVPSTGYTAVNFCSGKLWVVGWMRFNPSGPGTLEIRFSANHGKSWYGLQTVADSVMDVGSMTGQIRGSDIDLYWSQAIWTNSQYTDYRMVSGTILPDTLPPTVQVLSVPDSVNQAGDTVAFLAAIHDDGALLTARVLVDRGDGEIQSYTMPRRNAQGHELLWVIPQEGLYRYRIEAEDFWENVRSYPESGWASFHTAHWNAVEPSGHVQPFEYNVSVFPNPFNAVTTISFTLPQAGRVELNVFDVMGRRVRSVIGRTQGSPLPAGEHRMEFQGGDLPSGIYFVRLAAGEKSVIRKMVLLK